MQRIDQACANDHRSAVLVVVKYRDIQSLGQRFFDLETMRCGNVFQVDPAKRWRNIHDRINKRLHTGGIDFDIKHVNSGKALEQHTFALHHRLGGQWSKIPQTQNRGAVSNYRHQIALVGIAIGQFRVGTDRAYRFRHAGAISQRQLVLGSTRLGGFNGEFARFGKLVIIESLLFE